MMQQHQQQQQPLDIIQRWFPELANQGTCLVFDGTLPYKHRDVTYLAPALIVVSSGFPNVEPICYLNCVKGMEINPENPYIDRKTRICRTEYGCNWDPSKNLCEFARNISIAFGQSTPFYATKSQEIASGELKLDSERSLESMRTRLDAYKAICREGSMSSIETEAVKTNLMRMQSEVEATKAELTSYTENAPKVLAECESATKELKDRVEKLNSFNNSYRSEWEKLPAELAAAPYDDLSKQVLELTALVDAVDETIRMLVSYVDNDPDKVLKKVKELSVQKYKAVHTLEKISKIR